MTEIDSLEIKISAEASKANQAINSLVKNLDKLSTSLKFDTTSLENLGKINGNNFKKLGEGIQSFANAAKSLQNVNSSNFTKLANGLEKIASIDSSKLETLGRIDGNSFRGIGEGVKSLAIGLQNLQGIKKSDFNRLASGIERLASIQPGNIETVGNALKPLADGISILSNAKFDNKNFQNFINSLTRLANANVSGLANVDFSTLGNSIKSLAETLSGAEKVQQNTISMTNAIAKLASAGENANITAEALPNLAAKLKDFMQTMSGAEKLEADTIAFTQALAQLANAGKKAEITATELPKLGEELKKVFDTMSAAPRISKNTIAFTQALAQLANAGGRANTSLGTLGTNLGKTSSSMNGLENITQKATLNLKSMARQLLAAAGIYVSIYGAVKGLKNAIKSSMDYVETLNYFNAAFGQVAEKADLSSFEKMGYESAEAYFNSFSERAEQITQKMTGFKVSESGMLLNTNEKNLGINPEQLMNYQAMFGQMSNSMGVVSENALLMSDALTKIGADLASVRNMDFDKVWTDMASGLAGMSRTLDKYGANIRNVNLQQKLNELGIEANISALNQNDKALLRTIILLDSTRYAWGDMANTIQQPANQLRLIQSNFANLSRTIGNIFLPIIAKVLPYINAMVIALQRLAEKIVLLLGFENFEWGGIGGGTSSDILSQIYDDTEDVAGALSEATEKAKEFKNQLLGFDEVNKLTEPTEDISTTDVGLSGGNVGALDTAFKDIVSEYQIAWNKAFEDMENKANNIADKIVNVFKNKDYKGIGTYISTNISDALASINWESVYQGAKNFGTGLAEFLNGLITPDLFGNVAKTIAGFLNTKIYTVLSFGETFDFKNFGESIASGINNFFETFDFGALAETINIWINGIKDIIFATIKKTDWKNIFKGFGNFWSNLEFDSKIIISLTIIPKLLKAITASKIVTGFKKLGKATNVTKDSFWALKTGISDKNFGTGLNLAISNIRDNLSGLQKGTITAIAGFAEFSVISNSFEKLTLGTGNFLAEIGKIAGAVAAAGAAMYVALGPTGLAIAGIVGTIAAIKGINDAFNKIKAKEIGNTIKDAMSNPGGVPLSEITSNFSNALTEAASGFDTIKEKSSEMDSVQKNIENTWIEIYKIQEAMENGVLSVEEGKAQLETLFSELAILTEQKFSTMSTVIVSAYGEGGSFRNALDKMGADTEAAIDTMITYAYRSSERVKEIIQELARPDISTEEYQKLIKELATLTGEMLSFEQATSNFTYDMNSLQGKIDYSEIFLEDGSIDIDVLQKYLDEATNALSEYEDSLDSSGKEMAQYWQKIYESPIATEEDKAVAKANLDYIPQAVKEMKADAELQIIAFTDMLQNDFIAKSNTIIDNSIEKWNNKSSWSKFWSNLTKSEYVKEALGKQQKNIDELSAVLEKSLKDFQTEGVVWASDAAKEIYSSLFETETSIDYLNRRKKTTYTLKNDYEDIINKATEGIADLASERGKEAVTGYNKGISDNMSSSELKAKTWIEKVMKVIAESQDSHSPSKVTQKFGKDAIDGYNLGINQNINSSLFTLDSFMNKIMNNFSDISNKFFGVGHNAMQGLYNGLTDMENSIYSKTQGIAESIANATRLALKIHSPSRIMYELGDYTMQGFQNGLENMYRPILHSIRGFNSDLQIISAPNLKDIYKNYQYPSTNHSIYYEGIENHQNDNKETNILLREILLAIQEGKIIQIDGKELGRTVQEQDKAHFNMTGKGLFIY